jgi:putative DNA primase/helicase
MKPSDFAQDLANKIITQLTAGTAPWQRPWAEGQAYAPYNPVTGNRYRGINFVALLSSNYTDPRWMTYKQAQAQGWQVSAGEKSTRIQHWVWEEEQARLDKNGKPLLDEKGNVSKETVRLERPKVILAAVFNAEQIEGISTLETGRQYNWDPLEKAEKLLSASNARIKHSRQEGAHYRVWTDTIYLPDRERFANAANYYSTAMHELAHWTGHPERMDRDLAHPFGSEGYAREELRAEIASLVLGSELGIGYDPGQHASYVDSWSRILQDKPLEILSAAAAAEKISDYVLTIEQKQEIRREVVASVKKQIPDSERTYLAVPYEERGEAKAVGAQWDRIKKCWYVSAGVAPEKIATWELRNAEPPSLDPRREFAAVLTDLGAVVDGEHPIMDGKPQRIAAVNDKRGERTIFYIGHLDGIPNGYVENNRTKEVRRWKARGQHLSAEQKSELLAEANRRRNERQQLEQARFEATSKRLIEEFRALPATSERTAYHESKGIDALAGTRVRNGTLVVPGYDLEGKLWTVQYIQEDGTKRFARESRKHGCFHIVGAPNAAAGLQQINLSPAIVIAEGYATAATLAKASNAASVAAFDSGNLLAVASALHERWPDKHIVIAGDDDHRLENNPGRSKALEAAAAVKGVAIFPDLSVDQRQDGMTDFNDLGQKDFRIVSRDLANAIKGVERNSLREKLGELDREEKEQIESKNQGAERLA